MNPDPGPVQGSRWRPQSASIEETLRSGAQGPVGTEGGVLLKRGAGAG